MGVKGKEGYKGKEGKGRSHLDDPGAGLVDGRVKEGPMEHHHDLTEGHR